MLLQYVMCLPFKSYQTLTTLSLTHTGSTSQVGKGCQGFEEETQELGTGSRLESYNEESEKSSLRSSDRLETVQQTSFDKERPSPEELTSARGKSLHGKLEI